VHLVNNGFQQVGHSNQHLVFETLHILLHLLRLACNLTACLRLVRLAVALALSRALLRVLSTFRHLNSQVHFLNLLGLPKLEVFNIPKRHKQKHVHNFVINDLRSER
jgi:hypothetical protein